MRHCMLLVTYDQMNKHVSVLLNIWFNAVENLPSVHLLQCSHCDLYHIASMPKKKSTKQTETNWSNRLKAFSQLKSTEKLVSRVIYILSPWINPLWSTPRVCLFSLVHSRNHSRAADHKCLDHHCNHTVFNTILFAHIQSKGQQWTKRGKRGEKVILMNVLI